MKISIQVSGDKELAEKLRALPPAVSREHLLAAVEPAAKLIKEAVKDNIHDQASREHPAGTLRGTIEHKVTLKTKSRVAINVGPNAASGETTGYYGRFVEFGHAIVPSWGKLKGVSVGRVPPHPFMRPAFDENVERAIDIINDRLRRAIMTVAK